ncbi:hypothetical protein BH09PSE2_BH09PSE2_17170 [soil metagenome]
MIPWVRLDSTSVPDAGGELRLMRRGDEFSIMAGAIELMNSRLSGSEEALATLAIERLHGRPDPQVLIGGLGLGFTLRATLARVGPQAKVTVAELVPAVVRWARGPLAQVFDGCLDDPRVTVAEADVGQLIASAAGAYDLILLDVDNGPEGLIRPANDALYDDRGLAAARAALRPGGLLAVWSSAPNARFSKALARSALKVSELVVPAGRKGRGRHVIWLASRPPG